MSNNKQAIVELTHVTKRVSIGNDEYKSILDDVSLSIYAGDFLTVLGGNGAGKSTLFNAIAGTLTLTSGSIRILGEDVTTWSPQKRAKYLARVFQDPKMGTAPRMTVAENLALAKLRGQKRGLSLRNLSDFEAQFIQQAKVIGNHLDEKLNMATGDLSGGQRQALSLIMATMVKPELLLLDEHTAALDPKTSQRLMAMTDDMIGQQGLTALMVTHRMEDALQYGNRLLVMKSGKIVEDLGKKDKQALQLQDFYRFFE